MPRHQTAAVERTNDMPSLPSYLPSIAALGTVLIVAGVITAARPQVHKQVGESRRFMVVSSLTILTQSLHFLEELVTGFFLEFPAVFGLPPFTKTAFVVFNVAWLAIWVVALLGVRLGVVIAVWPLWFLALATVLNMVAHPLLALRVGAYFPGLFTSPAVGVLGVLLMRELARLTSRETSA